MQKLSAVLHKVSDKKIIDGKNTSGDIISMPCSCGFREPQPYLLSAVSQQEIVPPFWDCQAALLSKVQHPRLKHTGTVRGWSIDSLGPQESNKTPATDQRDKF